MKMADIYSSYLDDIIRLEKENKQLKKQLAEANEVIKWYGMGVVTVTDYWGGTQHTRQEETTSFPEKAVEYLKKWGVK